MKNLVLVCIALFLSVTLSAQKKEKIKGNKIVTDVYKTLEDFHAIEIADNLKVNITQSQENGYHLKADEN